MSKKNLHRLFKIDVNFFLKRETSARQLSRFRVEPLSATYRKLNSKAQFQYWLSIHNGYCIGGSKWNRCLRYELLGTQIGRVFYLFHFFSKTFSQPKNRNFRFFALAVIYSYVATVLRCSLHKPKRKIAAEKKWCFGGVAGSAGKNGNACRRVGCGPSPSVRYDTCRSKERRPRGSRSRSRLQHFITGQVSVSPRSTSDYF